MTRQPLTEAQHLRPCHQLIQVQKRCSDARRRVSGRALRSANAAYHLHRTWVSSGRRCIARPPGFQKTLNQGSRWGDNP